MYLSFWAELLGTQGALYPTASCLVCWVYNTVKPGSKVTYRPIRDKMGNLILQ